MWGQSMWVLFATINQLPINQFSDNTPTQNIIILFGLRAANHHLLTSFFLEVAHQDNTVAKVLNWILKVGSLIWLLRELRLEWVYRKSMSSHEPWCAPTTKCPPTREAQGC